VLISVLKAVSTINQADMIKLLLQEKGYEVEFKSTISMYDYKQDDVYGMLFFQLATAPFLMDAVVPYLFSDKPKVVYVTIEGIPTKANFLHTNIPKMNFIANSHFVAECLQKAGLNVIDVVHHAINPKDIQIALKYAEVVRKELNREYGDRCKLLYVGRHDPRKQLQKLSLAVNILNEQNVKDWILLLHTDASARPLFEKDNCHVISQFGSKRYVDTLALMAACDYLVFPSVCEGFGLPVLEANALGKPVLHCWFPPLSEFSSDEFNFTWEYDLKEAVNQGNVQYWIFHNYPEFVLADVMKWAIDVFHNSKQKYQEYCKKAKEHAKKWSYRKIYPRLLRHLNIR